MAWREFGVGADLLSHSLSLSLSLSLPVFLFRHTSHIWRVMSRPDWFDMLYECKGRSRERTAQEDWRADF